MGKRDEEEGKEEWENPELQRKNPIKGWPPPPCRVLLSFHSLMMFCVISSKIRNKNIRVLSSLTTHSHKLRL